MENGASLDWVLGLVAIAILLGGLFMLFSGISEMGKRK
ncbi:NAD synthetase [Romeria aff. gracilis LEGE 07310]|uniref:NAD synthetase n=1 Tax=Vasconcelosia minhoensis LEGE 07310 TaxID=915328 RepID=A0A8J7AH40_9CYAN|nr:NAD synthetase [Romeria aff. gracilis LEGE 07310]